jgi:phosphoserine aminotransferase
MAQRCSRDMSRPVFNFAAGPGIMPKAVLASARHELLDWNGKGISMLEMPFTGDDFRNVLSSAGARLRALLAVPDDYHILFMHGGASAQFSVVPLNLLGGITRANYIDSGYWSQKAIAEAQRYCSVSIAASGRRDDYLSIPAPGSLYFDSTAAYCHYTSNETANGTQFGYVPDCGGLPLVADMTSDFLTRPLDIRRYGLIYASAQKNIGPAGFTVVIVRDDLLGQARHTTPAVFNYRLQSDANSLVNTPNTFSIYLADLVFQWLLQAGGLTAMEHKNLRQSRLLYQAIEQSEGFFHCPVKPAHRSRVNICFTLRDESLTPLFLNEAAQHGLINLKGHARMGGVRASLYNAMPDEGVHLLTGFMRQFCTEHAALV